MTARVWEQTSWFSEGSGVPPPLDDPPGKAPADEAAHKQISRVSILLVEDNPFDVNVIRRALRDSGVNFELDVVSDGEQALSLLTKEAETSGYTLPSVILLDWNLPRVSGSEVLAYIRQNDRLRGIPVVVVTSTNSPADVREIRKLGANAHFRKPTDLDAYLDLKTIVVDLLSEPPKSSS
jgi:two-component system, chemotaxis family, response regulator Rcp1